MQTNICKYKHLIPSMSKGKPIWRIAIYVRLSKEDIRKRRLGKEESLSIINQIRENAFFIEDNMEDYVIYDIYIDDGKTGTDFQRDEYKRLLHDIELKRVNCIIVKDMTRYARNFADAIKELDRLVLEDNVRFISLEEYPDTKNLIDTLKDPSVISSARIYEPLDKAEAHARSTSIKVKSTKYIHQKTGEPSGGYPPFGFLPNPDPDCKTYIVDDVAQKIIMKIYTLSLEGYSDNMIAKILNDDGVPNPTNYKQNVLGLNYHNPHAINNSGLWWATTVRRILNDKNNIGFSVQHKSASFDHKRHKQIALPKSDYIMRENAHEALIDANLFETVQEIRKERSRVSKTGKSHIFANLVYCKGCNIAMKKNSDKYHSYLCCRTHSELKRCKSTTIRFDELENIVFNAIQEQISMVIDLKSIVDRISQLPNNPDIKSERLKSMYEHTETEIIKEEKIMDDSYYDWKNNDISQEQYKRVRENAEKKLLQLKATLQTISEEQYILQSGIRENNVFFERFLKYKDIEKLDREMLVELIDRIYISEDKRVEINFKYKDQYLLILDFIQQNIDTIQQEPTYQKIKNNVLNRDKKI